MHIGVYTSKHLNLNSRIKLIQNNSTTHNSLM